MLQVGYLQELY